MFTNPERLMNAFRAAEIALLQAAVTKKKISLRYTGKQYGAKNGVTHRELEIVTGMTMDQVYAKYFELLEQQK